jgi:LysM repeat protein
MDNISRDSNSSILPVAGVVVGVLALILSAVALAKIGSTKTDLAAQITTVGDKSDSALAAARDASTKTDGLAKTVARASDVQTVVTQIGAEISRIDGEVKAIKESSSKKASVTTKNGEPLVAGKDEYIVKSGDVGSKIAKATGFSTSAIAEVNPGIDWSKLKVGQKLKLPAKK